MTEINDRTLDVLSLTYFKFNKKLKHNCQLLIGLIEINRQHKQFNAALA